MKPLNLSFNTSMGVTLLSNTFIDDYMKDANDAQIKVYLYLLRMVGEGLPTDINEISELFNLTEKDALRSLKHWEQAGLISVQYDNNNEICGISFKNLNSQSAANVQPQIKNRVMEPISENVFMLKMDYEKEIDNYSANDIIKLKQNPEITTLLNVVGQYFRRPLNVEEIKTVLFIYDRLGFSYDLADYLLEYCADKKNSDIKYIAQVAINWYEEGVDDVKKAKLSVKKSDKNIPLIMNYLGIQKAPAPCELKIIHKWIYDFCFGNEIIEEACSRAVLNTDSGKNPILYADAILSKWHVSNVRTINDIKKLDYEHEETKKTSEKTSSQTYSYGNSKSSVPNKQTKKSSSNTFCQIEEVDYDFEALEKAALSR